MRVNVFHSPFRRWVRGLSWELLAFAAYLVVVTLVVAVVVYVV